MRALPVAVTLTDNWSTTVPMATSCSSSTTIAKWHTAVLHKQFSLLDELLDDDVVLRTPVYLKGRRGKPLVSFVLSMVLEVILDFKYVVSESICMQ